MNVTFFQVFADASIVFPLIVAETFASKPTAV